MSTEAFIAAWKTLNHIYTIQHQLNHDNLICIAYSGACAVQVTPYRKLLSVRPYSQPLRGSWTRTVMVSPLLKGKSFGLDEVGWETRALIALPSGRPRDSPTELERERLGIGDGAWGHEKNERKSCGVTDYFWLLFLIFFYICIKMRMTNNNYD